MCFSGKLGSLLSGSLSTNCQLANFPLCPGRVSPRLDQIIPKSLQPRGSKACRSHRGKVTREVVPYNFWTPQAGEKDRRMKAEDPMRSHVCVCGGGVCVGMPLSGMRSHSSQHKGQRVIDSLRSPPSGSMGAMKHSQGEPPPKALRTSREALLSGTS